MKSISDEIWIIKRLNYGIVKGKKVKVLEGAVMKHLDIERFQRWNGDTDPWRMVADWIARVWMSGRGWLQRYRGGLDWLHLPWLSGR